MHLIMLTTIREAWWRQFALHFRSLAILLRSREEGNRIANPTYIERILNHRYDDYSE